MKRISLAEFRRRCLEVVDIIAATCEPVVITKNGKPIAKLVPAGRPMQDFLGVQQEQLRLPEILNRRYNRLKTGKPSANSKISNGMRFIDSLRSDC